MGNEALKEWRKKHVQEGLCVDCNKEAKEGFIRCEKHLELQIKYAKNRNRSKLKRD